MGRSLRWTLLWWYGGLLAATIVAFGATLYIRATQALTASVDNGLQMRGRAMLEALGWDEEEEHWEVELSEQYVRGFLSAGWFEYRDGKGTLLGAGGAVVPALPGEVAGFQDRGDERLLVLDGPKATRVRLGRPVTAERA